MNHRGWFTLVVRAIGLLLLGFSALYVPYAAEEFIQRVSQSWDAERLGAIPPAMLWSGLRNFGTVLQLAFGLYLFLGGRWIIDRCLRDAGAETPQSETSHTQGPAS